MTDVNTVAEPSAATPEKVQYTGWDEHGKPVVEKPPEPPKKQDSAPADPPKEATSEGKPKSTAEPGAATKQEPKGKPNAEERIAELISDRKRLEAELREERSRKLEAPKAEPAKETKAVEPPKRPNPYTFKGTPEEFDKAMDDYEKARDEYSERKFAEKQLANARNQVFVARVNEARERYGAEKFDETIEPVSKAIMEQALPTVKAYMQRSEMFAHLLYVIGGTEKSLDDFMATAKSDDIAAIRKLAYLEIEIGKELAKGKEKSDDKKSDDNSDDPNKKAPADKKEPPAEPKPRAPKPPSEVGGRGTTPPDEEMAAVRANDFRGLDSAMKSRYFRAAK